jgi:hypothetical protein
MSSADEIASRLTGSGCAATKSYSRRRVWSSRLHSCVSWGPSASSFWLLRAGFTLAPVLFGLDKLAGVLADWPTYLWSGVDRLLPGSANDVMLAVGVIEILAGVVDALRSRLGGYVVAAWLAGIIVNLLLVGGFHDIVLRDVGLLLGALARLGSPRPPGAARTHEPARTRPPGHSRAPPRRSLIELAEQR